jgi:hypothetical protein
MNNITLASEWEAFRRTMRPNTQECVVEDLRIAFYSGGLSLMTALAEVVLLIKLDLPPAARVQLARLIDELSEFSQQVINETP